MNTILIILIIIILLIFIFALGGLNYYFISKNNGNAVQQTIKSFSAKIDPTTGNSTGFKGQLSCPAGTNINIISAFYDIDDPYATCSANISQVNPLVAFMCNPSVSSPGVCEVGKNECPSGTKCNSSGHCQLIKANGSCPANTSPITYNGQTYCVNTDVCGAGVPNPVCSPNGSGQCAIRDASASVSQKCNGKNNCDDLSVSDFGDTPCNFSPPAGGCWSSMGSNGPNWVVGGVSGRPNTGYCALPYGPGWGGGAPDYGSNSDSPSGNLGYTMHGIYNCS